MLLKFENGVMDYNNKKAYEIRDGNDNTLIQDGEIGLNESIIGIESNGSNSNYTLNLEWNEYNGGRIINNVNVPHVYILRNLHYENIDQLNLIKLNSNNNRSLSISLDLRGQIIQNHSIVPIVITTNPSFLIDNNNPDFNIPHKKLDFVVVNKAYLEKNNY